MNLILLLLILAILIVVITITCLLYNWSHRSVRDRKNDERVASVIIYTVLGAAAFMILSTGLLGMNELAGIKMHEDELATYEQAYMEDVVAIHNHIVEATDNPDVETYDRLRANEEVFQEIEEIGLRNNVESYRYKKIDFFDATIPVEYLDRLEVSQANLFGLVDEIKSNDHFYLLSY